MPFEFIFFFFFRFSFQCLDGWKAFLKLLCHYVPLYLTEKQKIKIPSVKPTRFFLNDMKLISIRASTVQNFYIRDDLKITVNNWVKIYVNWILWRDIEILIFVRLTEEYDFSRIREKCARLFWLDSQSLTQSDGQ